MTQDTMVAFEAMSGLPYISAIRIKTEARLIGRNCMK